MKSLERQMTKTVIYTLIDTKRRNVHRYHSFEFTYNDRIWHRKQTLILFLFYYPERFVHYSVYRSFASISITTQVQDSGDQIPKEPAGRRWKKRWILQEYTGSHWNMEAVFQPENFRIFPVISYQFLAENTGK